MYAMNYTEQPMQTTVRKVICFEGLGLHSARYVHVEIHPAPANTGIQFLRTDVDFRRQTIQAHPANVRQARLCTRIVNDDGVRMDTIEHIMAAFAGLGVDNAVVKVDSFEAPILDGSSRPVVRAIHSAGIVTLPVRRRSIVVTHPVRIEHDMGWAQLEPSDSLEIDVEISFPDPAIGTQSYCYTHGDGCFEEELADARTFCQYSDVRDMKNAGLGLGGTLDNAVVVDNGNIMNDGGLRMEGEFVRHKALDCLGDLYLLGMMTRARLTASRPGHTMCAKLIHELWQRPECFRIVEEGIGFDHSDAYVLPEAAAAAAV